MSAPSEHRGGKRSESVPGETAADVRQVTEVLQATLDALSANIVVIDGRGDILFVNEAWRAFAASNGATRSVQTGVGLNYLSICHAAAAQADEVATEAAKGIKGVLAGLQPSFQLVYPCHSPDRERWFEMHVTRMDAGREHAVICHMDITGRERAQQELEASKEQFRQMVETSPFPVSLIDADGRYLYVNPRFVEVFGYSLEDVPSGNAWFTQAYPDVTYRQRAVATWVSDVVQRKTTYRVRDRVFSVTCKNGSVRDILFRPLSVGGGRQFVMYEDVTERRRVEEEQRRHASDLGFMARSAMELIQLQSGQDVYRFIGQRIKELVGENMIVAVSDFDEDTNQFRPRAILGLGRTIEAIRKLIGKDPMELTGDFGEEAREALLAGELRKLHGGLRGLAGDMFPQAAMLAIAKLLGIRDIYVHGFVRSGKVFGGLVIVQRDETPLASGGLIEAFIGQAAIALEHHKAEEQLRRLTQHQETLLSAIPDIVMEVDTRKVYTWANLTGYAFFGEDVIGREAADFFEGEQDTYAKVQPLFNGDPNLFYVESWQRRKDGERRLLAWWCRTLKDASGNVTGALSTARDVTELRRTEELLRESEEQHRELVENANSIILRWDHAGRILFMNPYGLAFFGFAEDELLGRNVMETIVPETETGSERDLALMIDEIKRDPERYRLNENENITKDGKRVWVAWTNKAILEPGGDVAEILSIGSDISEQKRLEAQLLQAQKMEAVGRLAAGVAHDLNNLLSPILAYADIVLEDLGAGDPRREPVEEIHNAGLRATDLVRQLLAFGRKQPMQLKTVDLNQVVVGFEKLLRRTIREDIEIQTVSAPRPLAIRADVGQLEQLIMNLAVNAQDAMPDGGRLFIETAQTDLDSEYASAHRGVQPGCYAMLAVTDTGHGMDAHTCEHIFEPFFTTKEKGTGLGLATVYGIVKQHGGNIWVYSEPGKGSTFKMYLPVVMEMPVEVHDPSTPLPRALSGTETVLVVEDDDMVRNVTVSILRRQGYVVLAAPNAREALSVLEDRENPVHLLLTDVVMPDMNGRELFREVSQTRPEIKVLYMSGYTDAVVGYRGIHEDAAPFIQKPFSIRGLAEKVRLVLDS